MVLQVLAFKLRLKGRKRAKSEDLAPANAIECTALEPKGHDRAHASLARKAHVALAANGSPATPWVFRAVMCA